MSDSNEFGGLEGDEGDKPKGSETGGGLRAKLEEALTRAKAAEDKLAETTKTLKTREAADLFGKFGVPDKVQKFYTGDVTEEAITAWCKENADVFGISVPGAEASESPEDKQRNDAMRGTQAASRLGFDGMTHSAETAMNEANAKLKAGASEAELDEMLGNLFKR